MTLGSVLGNDVNQAERVYVAQHYPNWLFLAAYRGREALSDGLLHLAPSPVKLDFRCQHQRMYFTAHINRMWPRAETHDLPVSAESGKNIPPLPPAAAATAAANLQWVVSKVSCLMWGGGVGVGGWGWGRMCAGLTCARWKTIASVKVWLTGSVYRTSRRRDFLLLSKYVAHY